jgi:hypothetical protein
MGRTILGARRGSFGVGVLLTAFLVASCFDEIPDPTQGFIEVDAGGVAGVEVFLDGVSQGTSLTLGPLDAGSYRVRVERAGYEIVPAEQDVVVQPAQTMHAAFALTLAFTGAVRVEAEDEVRGTEVTAGEILVDTGGGTFTATGLVPPAVVAALPPGPVRFVVRAAGFAESDPVEANVVVADTSGVTARLGPPRAVLAEMFTYVLCPNCPEAAAKLEELHEAHPGRFFAIEWHVVYPLPLYDPRWPAREIYYGGGASLGRPAAVFQGGADDDPVLVLGSQASELALYEARTEEELDRCANDCPLALVVDGGIGSLSADATVRILWRGGGLPGTLVLRCVLIENDVQAPGNQPRFGFVARELLERPVAFSVPGEILEEVVSVPVNPAWDLDQLHLLVFVQSDPTREVLAVGGLP